LDVVKTLRWADVVCKSADWSLMTGHVIILPLTKESNDEITSELSREDLSEEVDVRHESGLEDDWDVRSVEQFDWVWLLETSHLSTGKTELNTESLEVDDYKHDNSGGEEVAEVWSVLPIECLLQAIKLVWFGDEEMECGDNGTLEFSSLISSNGDWGEALPEDSLTDVGGNEE